MGDLFDFGRFGERARGARRNWHGADRAQAILRQARRDRPGAGSRWTLAILCGVALGLGVPIATGDRTDDPASLPRGAPAAAGVSDRLSARFGLCHSGGGIDCVVDGDTFWFQGERIRIADIDTPETHPSRCAAEADLGARATARLRGLLNAGAFSLESIDRDTDRYGRKLRVVTRNGDSLGETLVSEGLARRYQGGRRAGWCGDA